MREYYLDRLKWIFTYRKSGVGYAIFKTLCLVIGLPMYAVLFVVEMLLTLVNMLFMWIPVVNVVISVICRCLIFICDIGFYVCILPDIGEYTDTHNVAETDYEIVDDEEQLTQE